MAHVPPSFVLALWVGSPWTLVGKVIFEQWCMWLSSPCAKLSSWLICPFSNKFVVWGKTLAWKHASSLKAIDWPSPSPPSSSSSSPRVFDVLVHNAQMLLCSTLSLSPCAAQEKKETVKTNYSLSDTVFAKAELNCDGRVCIWLGVSPNGSAAVEYQSGTSPYHEQGLT